MYYRLFEKTHNINQMTTNMLLFSRRHYDIYKISTILNDRIYYTDNCDTNMVSNK